LRFRAPSEVEQEPSARDMFTTVVARMAPRCLSWTSAPYDTCQRGGVLPDDASGVAARHVRGLATPFAASHHLASRPATPLGVTRLPTPQGCWSAHGIAPARVFPQTRSVPLPRPVPSCRFRAPWPSPVGDTSDARPPSRPCSRAESVPTGMVRDESRSAASRRSLLGVLASSEFAPVCLGSRFDREASPHALRQGDVPVCRGPRVSKCTQGADPSRDLQLS
jgi:hypothetical protein